MPPKPKFTRQLVIDTGFALVREQGASALTARELASRLGASPSPIFTLFCDMDEVRGEVFSCATVLFKRYMAVAEDYCPAYKKRGMQWVRFAQDEPELFRMLFMQKTDGELEFTHVIRAMPFGWESDTEIIMHDYHATQEQAGRLFRQMWIYTYGLCVLCANRVCTFTEEEIAVQLGEIFSGMIHVLRAGGVPFSKLQPMDAAKADILNGSYPDLREREAERQP